MLELKKPVQQSFERIKKAAKDDILVISPSDLKKEIIFCSAPLNHLYKLKDSGLIDYVLGKNGGRDPMTITILV